MSLSFDGLGTPQIADAVLRLQLDLRMAPPGLQPVRAADRVAGRVLPSRHYGSVDVFFEAYESAEGGEVFVIDNQGRTDEACIGDLTVIEAQAAGLSGLIVWGLHRDTPELLDFGLPVFSYGTIPAGPRRVDPTETEALDSAQFGDFRVTRDDYVFADVDGAVFVPVSDAADVLEQARMIRETEEAQASLVREGLTLRQQLRFSEYLLRRSEDPSYTLRQHLRASGGAIEE